MEIRKQNQKLKMQETPKSENQIIIEMLEKVDKKLDKTISLIKTKKINKE